MSYKHDLILQVREFLERHLDVYEIASRMKLDPAQVQMIIDTINNLLT
jgi:hypothetical protein